MIMTSILIDICRRDGTTWFEIGNGTYTLAEVIDILKAEVEEMKKSDG